MSRMLEVRGVWKSYEAGIAGCQAHVRVLQGASLVLHAGERMLVTGGPGAGKSTLLHCITGLRRPDAGEVCWNGTASRTGDWWRLRCESADEAIARGGPWPLLIDLGESAPGSRWLSALAARSPSSGWLVLARHAGALAPLADSMLELHEGALRPVRIVARARRVAEEGGSLR